MIEISIFLFRSKYIEVGFFIINTNQIINAYEKFYYSKMGKNAFIP